MRPGVAATRGAAGDRGDVGGVDCSVIPILSALCQQNTVFRALVGYCTFVGVFRSNEPVALFAAATSKKFRRDWKQAAKEYVHLVWCEFCTTCVEKSDKKNAKLCITFEGFRVFGSGDYTVGVGWVLCILK